MPIPGLICSPLKLIPKARGKGKYRLIHNLAFPFDHNSVNANILDDEAKVKYLKFDNIIKLGLKHGISAHARKVDFDVVFRNFPVIFHQLSVLGFTLEGEFFINSSMAFSTRSSYKILDEFATAIQWAIENKTQSKDFFHYLDDFIMIHAVKAVCSWYMKTVQKICENIRAPLLEAKTEGPTWTITFLGLLINFFKQVITIPQDKVDKAIEIIQEAIASLGKTGNARWKITMKDIQKITDTLNFFCRVIPCGHPFLRRLYDLQSKVISAEHGGKSGIKPNPQFKVCLNEGVCRDLAMWLKFLNSREFYMHRRVPFLHFMGAEGSLLLFANANGNLQLGFGCYFPQEGEWSYGRWPVGMFRENGKEKIPNIALSELLAIIMAPEIWAPQLRVKQIRLRSDN